MSIENNVVLDEEVIVPAGLSAADTRLALARRLIGHMRQQLEALERLIAEQDQSAFEEIKRSMEEQQRDVDEAIRPFNAERVLEGVFDGQHMVAEDGRTYLVPPNYASKSKLVEGDFLRLTITDTGRFVFKQRGPIERQRCLGMLVYDEQTDEWRVVVEGNAYKVLAASISYYKGQAGDDAVILVPRANPSEWAALENIVRHDLSEFSA